MPRLGSQSSLPWVSAIALIGVVTFGSAYRYRYALTPMLKGGRPMQAALGSGDLSIVSYLAGGGSRSIHSRHASVLFAAALREQDFELVKHMMDQGMDLNALVNGRDTQLHLISRQGNTEALFFLLENTSQLNLEMADAKGLTPLQVAADPKIAIVLIQLGANIDVQNEQDQSVLAQALSKNWEEVVELCLMKIKTTPELAHVLLADGDRMLPRALNQRNYALAERLMNDGFQMSGAGLAQTDLSWLPMKYLHTVEAAIVDTNMTEVVSQKILHVAAAGGDKAMVKRWLDKGVDINSPNSDGQTVIHQALWSGWNTTYSDPAQAQRARDVFWLLVEAGADLNTLDFQGDGILHKAVSPHWPPHASTGEIQRLLQSGANINLPDDQGNTPLHYANTPEVAALLIQAGADVTAKNKRGKTPAFSDAPG